MSEKRFTNVSMGREEAYCDFSIIKVGDKIISEIPTTDAIRICDLLNEQQDAIKQLKEENEQLKKELDCIKKTNKLYGYNVECDYEWYEESDKDE